MPSQYFSTIPIVKDMTSAISVSFLAFFISFVKMRFLLQETHIDQRPNWFYSSLYQSAILYLIFEIEMNLSFWNVLILFVVLLISQLFDLYILAVSTAVIFLERMNIDSYKPSGVDFAFLNFVFVFFVECSYWSLCHPSMHIAHCLPFYLSSTWLSLEWSFLPIQIPFHQSYCIR